MTTFLLFLHVAAAVLLIGPVTVAVSAFPKAAQNAQSGSEEAVGRASFLHSMSTKYGLISLLVPLLGGGLLAFDWETHKSNYWMHRDRAQRPRLGFPVRHGHPAAAQDDGQPRRPAPG